MALDRRPLNYATISHDTDGGEEVGRVGRGDVLPVERLANSGQRYAAWSCVCDSKTSCGVM